MGDAHVKIEPGGVGLKLEEKRSICVIVNLNTYENRFVLSRWIEST